MKTNIEFLKGIQAKSASVAGLIGAGIPLSWLLFLILVKSEDFETWMIVPLTFIPLGGLFGGLFFYLMGFIWFPSGGRKLAAIIFSTVVYFIGIWLSAVLSFSLVGLWD
ncbi:potassium transporter KefB [Algoriphagus yeomjeoni]|uniref:Uncharacterized protein n=1 Tax=Algoriphagus yeomjeoni TaxID=291403 RepID=A0A327PD42_9BACT|nr:potassium transporter KefB [Algoriphagus yeomjeoni]RAI89417.1 hypothetical protein LV83_02459 [Algoriphagus yeomjeoni]